MEDMPLLEAIERYLANEMPAAERAHFEKLRQSNSEIDQMVVEHKLFLHQIEGYADRRNYKHSLHETHANLSSEDAINTEEPAKSPGRVINFWNKYRRVVAIAASIAGITAVIISALVVYYTPVKSAQIQQLNRKIEEIKRNQRVQGNILNDVKSKIPEGASVISGGSAFMIDGHGYLVTNAHVLKASRSVVVNSKGQEFNAVIVFRDAAKDLAILKIDDKDFKQVSNPPYSIRKTSVDLGEEVFTLGYPRNEIVYNMGYMSARTGFEGDTSACQISLSANPGNSGGPVFNRNGEVIGILSTREMKAEGVVFAVKSREIYNLIQELKDSDSTAENIKVPVASTLKGLNRVQQIKNAQDFVYLVKAYN
ncbi:MAG: trypsin-like peptidase protein [Chitinophagaceae bacterium]|nr:trypsin-like peptidase protein [Chitinophagaceae bacterium]